MLLGFVAMTPSEDYVYEYVKRRMLREKVEHGRGWATRMHQATGISVAHFSNVTNPDRNVNVGHSLALAMALQVWGFKNWSELEQQAALEIGEKPSRTPEPASRDGLADKPHLRQVVAELRHLCRPPDPLRDPREVAYALSLAETWDVDLPVDQWHGMVNAYRVAHLEQWRNEPADHEAPSRSGTRQRADQEPATVPKVNEG